MITTSQTIGYLGANSAIFAISSLVFVKTIMTLKSWDFKASTKEQYENENRLHLLSSTASFLILFKTLLTLFLFYMIDSLTPFIKAAMCGVGVVNATNYGWELIVLKIALLYLFLLWISVDRVDRERFDYPFARFKMWFFIAIFLVMGLEIVLDFSVIIGLDTQKVVSCCSVTFASSNKIGSMLSLGCESVAIYFFIVYAIYLVFGVLAMGGKKAFSFLFGIASIALAVVGVIAIIFAISPYIYELPTHTCPFCLIQKEYNYVGYLLYISLFLGSYYGLQSMLLRLLLGVDAGKSIKKSLMFSTLFVAIGSYFVLSYIIKNGAVL